LASYDGKDWVVYQAGDFGLTNEQINTIAVDDQNHIWIGTLDGAAMYDGKTWTAINEQNSNLVDNAVFSITVQTFPANDVIWFGTLSGVSSLNPKTGEWKNFTRQEVDLGWGGVSELMFDSSGILWVCTEGGGINLWNGKEWTHIRVSNSHLPYSIVETVAELEPGLFWIAASIPNSAGGVLAKYDGTSWSTYKEGLTGYSGAETLTIDKDNTGRYWFGTRNNGISLYEPKK
jgi:ligand-binding sensor domain-containing protein